MVDLLNSQHNNDNDNFPFNVFSHALSSSGTSTDPKLPHLLDPKPKKSPDVYNMWIC